MNGTAPPLDVHRRDIYWTASFVSLDGQILKDSHLKLKTPHRREEEPRDAQLDT